jgi:hypothetical protein|tara:strand:+ start:8184 stop:8447 length:264 start_codon:yes stop_codon:yes gene_type:complete
MYNKMIGSRAQVFHGTADQTAGGLKKKDLILDNGEIKSKAAQQAALARMKKEGKKHLVKVFKPTKKGFKLQPKEGTKAYKTKVAKMA